MEEETYREGISTAILDSTLLNSVKDWPSFLG